jgi:Carboxypeptidase regulatory-like domain
MRQLLLLPIALILLSCLAMAQPRGSFRGTIKDAEGKRIVGAAIRILGTKLGALSKADGTYQTARIPAGKYTITITALGYLPHQASIDIVADATARLDVVLQADTTPRRVMPPPMPPERTRQGTITGMRLSAQDLAMIIRLQPVRLPRNMGTVRTITFDGQGWPRSSNQGASPRPALYGGAE